MTPDETDLNICPSCEGKITESQVCPECGWSGLPQDIYSLEPLEIGVVLQDRYEVIEQLSASGERGNGFESRIGGINCYLMMDKQSQSAVMVKEVAIPIEDDKSTKLNEEFECHDEISCVSEEIDSILDVNSELCDKDIEAVKDNCPKEQTKLFIESDDESHHFGPGSQPSDLPENSPSTSEPDSVGDYELSDQQNLKQDGLTQPRRQAQLLSFERLQAERSIIEELKYPTVVKMLDYFEDDGRAYLVEEYFESCTLWDAWHLPDTSVTQRIDWLIQLCQALAKAHGANVLYNAVTPKRLRVSNENRLVLTDFSSAVKLPLEEKHQQGVDFYVAPELVLELETVDIRADLYSLGVMWYELLLGRELTEEDFECQFILKPLQDYVPDLHPTINQLLLKLTSHNPDLRFASKDEVESGKQPIISLQRHLLKLKQDLAQSTLVVGSRTNIGLQRASNEDNFWAQNLSYRNLDGYTPMGLFIVADGMGGAEAGEVASKIVIQTVSDTLLPKLMALRDCFDDDHSEDLLPQIKDAIISANQEIIAQTEQVPFWRGMGSTVTLAAIVGMRAYVGHVGDSRLYLVNGEGIQQKTTDHSIVSRLLQIGAITEEEAETHPQRDVLLKAVGARTDIEPDTFSFEIKRGDILLLCSDGLTKHQEDGEIHQIVMNASSKGRKCRRFYGLARKAFSLSSIPQQACDSLVNRANLCGGEDNITVIVIQVVDITN
ncbi:MAG: protein kinase [Candidatus Poribacteria bacterium]